MAGRAAAGACSSRSIRKAANDRGIRNGEKGLGEDAPDRRRRVQACVKALVTERVDRETVFLPFHFSGRWEGVDMLVLPHRRDALSCAARR